MALPLNRWNSDPGSEGTLDSMTFPRVSTPARCAPGTSFAIVSEAALESEHHVLRPALSSLSPIKGDVALLRSTGRCCSIRETEAYFPDRGMFPRAILGSVACCGWDRGEPDAADRKTHPRPIGRADCTTDPATGDSETCKGIAVLLTSRCGNRLDRSRESYATGNWRRMEGKNRAKVTRIRTLSLNIMSVLWMPDTMFHDMSKLARLMAEEADMLFMGSLVNWLCERSRLSRLESVNALSGNVLSLLRDRSTMRSFFRGLRTSAGISVITFQERNNACRFLLSLKQSRSISTSWLCLRSSHCKCGMLPKTSLLMFLSWLFDMYRWVMEYSTGLK